MACIPRFQFSLQSRTVSPVPPSLPPETNLLEGLQTRTGMVNHLLNILLLTSLVVVTMAALLKRLSEHSRLQGWSQKVWHGLRRSARTINCSIPGLCLGHNLILLLHEAGLLSLKGNLIAPVVFLTYLDALRVLQEATHLWHRKSRKKKSLQHKQSSTLL